jgi:hypothetical protein
MLGVVDDCENWLKLVVSLVPNGPFENQAIGSIEASRRPFCKFWSRCGLADILRVIGRPDPICSLLHDAPVVCVYVALSGNKHIDRHAEIFKRTHYPRRPTFNHFGGDRSGAKQMGVMSGANV